MWKLILILVEKIKFHRFPQIFTEKIQKKKKKSVNIKENVSYIYFKKEEKKLYINKKMENTLSMSSLGSKSIHWFHFQSKNGGEKKERKKEWNEFHTFISALKLMHIAMYAYFIHSHFIYFQYPQNKIKYSIFTYYALAFLIDSIIFIKIIRQYYEFFDWKYEFELLW